MYKRQVLPFDIPFIGASPEKAPAPAKKAPLTPETIRNRRGPAFETVSYTHLDVYKRQVFIVYSVDYQGI